MVTTMITKKVYILSTLVVLGFICTIPPASSFSLLMMGTRRGKGGMKIDVSSSSSKSTKSAKSQIASLNNGRGQEITGVSLPAPGKLELYLDKLQNNKISTVAHELYPPLRILLLFP
jgi:flagellar biosynthesis component FlhA